MPPAWAAGCRLKWRNLNKANPNITVPEYSQAAFGRGEGEKSLFFSPPHPGHRVSQGSGNRGDAPAPPTPQARPRRVRKVQNRLPTSSWRRQWMFHCAESHSSVSWPHTYLRPIRKVNITERQNSICTLSSFPGSQAALGFTSIRGWFSTGETEVGWGESEEREEEGIEFSRRRALIFRKPFFAGRASPSSPCCFDIRYRFMSSEGKHETRKGQILTPSRQGKHWPSPGSAVI